MESWTVTESNRLHRLWRDWRGFLLFAVCLFFFRTTIADWNVVPSGSMKPTILEGDRILVDRLAFDAKVPLTDIPVMHLGDPQRGDIVVFSSPRDGIRLVKRLIGLPGDLIELRGNRLFINGHEAGYAPLSPAETARLDWQPRPDQQVLAETIGNIRHPVIVERDDSPYSSFGPVRVPDGHYLMLGDNRDNSADSRYFGFVPRNLLIGRSGEVLASLNPDHYYLPRRDRFLHPLP